MIYTWKLPELETKGKRYAQSHLHVLCFVSQLCSDTTDDIDTEWNHHLRLATNHAHVTWRASKNP